MFTHHRKAILHLVTAGSSHNTTQLILFSYDIAIYTCGLAALHPHCNLEWALNADPTPAGLIFHPWVNKCFKRTALPTKCLEITSWKVRAYGFYFFSAQQKAGSFHAVLLRGQVPSSGKVRVSCRSVFELWRPHEARHTPSIYLDSRNFSFPGKSFCDWLASRRQRRQPRQLLVAVKPGCLWLPYHDLEWRNGTLCKCAGIISTISSEVSVIMLTAMTADRLVSIVFPFTVKSLSLKKGRLICILAWTAGIVFAIFPIVGISYFYDNTNEVGFYGRSAVCLPLQLSSDKLAGWEYSVAIFIGFNATSFVFIMGAYIVMFKTVYQISKDVGSVHSSRDASVAKRMLFIVLTDFCCWVPVIVIGILSLTGNFHDPTNQIYVWIAVFVLPVNSSLNPILYTFSTRPAIKKIRFYRHAVVSLVSKGRHSTKTPQGKIKLHPRLPGNIVGSRQDNVNLVK